MLEFSYLSRGLNALARAHQMSAMAGHLGAAVVAGYFVGEQRPDLEEEVFTGIKGDLKRVMAGESVFGRRMTKEAKILDGELFEPFPREKADESLIDGIAEALAKNIGSPRQSGHNVIFASLAIRALREHPELATPAVTDGIRKLIALFDGAHPGSGYYGREKGRLRGDKVILPEEGPAPYGTLEEMAQVVFGQFLTLDPRVHQEGYGGLVHVNNHAAAITDLARYGYAQLVPQALKSHHRHLRLWKALPDVAGERGPLKRSAATPHSAAYWTSGAVPTDRALLTHRVKTMFGFEELSAMVEDEAKRALAHDKLRYLM